MSVKDLNNTYSEILLEETQSSRMGSITSSSNKEMGENALIKELFSHIESSLIQYNDLSNCDSLDINEIEDSDESEKLNCKIKFILANPQLKEDLLSIMSNQVLKGSICEIIKKSKIKRSLLFKAISLFDRCLKDCLDYMFYCKVNQTELKRNKRRFLYIRDFINNLSPWFISLSSNSILLRNIYPSNYDESFSSIDYLNKYYKDSIVQLLNQIII